MYLPIDLIHEHVSLVLLQPDHPLMDLFFVFFAQVVAMAAAAIAAAAAATAAAALFIVG